jgi:hypothetical protein
MSTVTETSDKRQRTWIYWTSLALLVILAIGGIVAYRGAKADREARDKADQLIAEIEKAGGTAPSQDQIARVLGNDGGAVCAEPNKALSRAVLLAQLGNGAAGPGYRATIADSRLIQGELLIIKVYCPEYLSDFQEFVDDLKTDDVAE